ncbi:MAG: rubrerythrin family protein, partial [Verrucomicrobiaceae bacterium]
MPLLRTSLLKSEPAGTLKSLDELFALANAMEQEAANRYASLAKDMRLQGKHSLADIFEQLAAAEREHVDSVASWSLSHLGSAPNPALVRWDTPETFEPHTVSEITTSRLMTPYRALSIAVRNEERAFAFWSYVAGYAEDPEIKKAAETMAREELGHVATLRKERRRAYHDGSGAMSTRRQSNVSASGQVDAAVLEHRLAEHLAGLEHRVDGASAHRAKQLLQETRDISFQTVGIGRFSADLERA